MNEDVEETGQDTLPGNEPKNYQVTTVLFDRVSVVDVWADEVEAESGTLCFYRVTEKHTLRYQKRLFWIHKIIQYEEVRELVAMFGEGTWASFGLVDSDYGILGVPEPEAVYP